MIEARERSPELDVVLARPLRDEMLAQALRESPQECCGLLIGRGTTVAALHPARNELQSPTRYRIDPRDHFAAMRLARSQGFVVIGAYHSHPASEPRPSPTDRAEAWPDFVYVIVSPAPAFSGRPVRAWRLVEGNFMECRLVTPEEEHEEPPCA